MVKYKPKNYGEIALKLYNDFLQGLNEQEKQDLYLCTKYYDENINESKEQEQQDHKWKCDLCEKQYECKDELKTHEKEHHDSNESKPKGDNIENGRKIQEINSKCSHCKREFNNSKDFKIHENKCH